MSRLLYDSVTATDIPLGVEMVAGYSNGRYANYAALKQRFPTIPVLGISVRADHSHLAHVLDIEQGDASPSQFYGWATSMANAGVHRPTAYISRSAAPGLLAGRPRRVTVDLWVADWTGFPHELSFTGANVVAVQYASPTTRSGGHFDISAVWDDSWHPG